MPIFIGEKVANLYVNPQVAPHTSGYMGPSDTYRVWICDKGNLLHENWKVKLCEGWGGTVLGSEAARLFRTSDFGFVDVMLYDPTTGKMNGYRSQVRVNRSATNPYLVLLSWLELEQFFHMRKLTGGLVLTPDFNKLGSCLDA